MIIWEITKEVMVETMVSDRDGMYLTANIVGGVKGNNRCG